MTGCWRLLAVISLIFVGLTVAPSRLRGQDVAADRSLVSAPAGTHAVAVVPSPDLPRLRHPMPAAPVWIPPSLPEPHPIAPGTIGLQPRVFQQLVRAAGIIFTGRVTAVGRGASSLRPDTASTTVTFQVEQAMRGAAVGQNLTIHEWAGLWARGERYRVGDHVLLFLYSPSKLGLTSPVAGAMGRFALDGHGKIVISAQQMAVLAANAILGGKTVVSYADFGLAVRDARQEGAIEP